jgi:hypothetical protein
MRPHRAVVQDPGANAEVHQGLGAWTPGLVMVVPPLVEPEDFLGRFIGHDDEGLCNNFVNK